MIPLDGHEEKNLLSTIFLKGMLAAHLDTKRNNPIQKTG